MPQQNSFAPPANNPFGPSVFSTTWANSRTRGNTLASIRSSDGPSSPAQSSFSRDSLADTDVRTLDYLGLVDTPQPPRATLAPSDVELALEQRRLAAYQSGNIGELAALTKSANRFRSYSVNAKEKYADDDESDMMGGYPGTYSGSLTPTAQESAAAYAIHEAVRQHNLEVQAFANLASASRPRARTAGVLDSPSSRLMRTYLPTSSRLDNSITAADLAGEGEYSGLTEAVQQMQLNNKPINDGTGEDNTLEGPTRALWLGNIPSSTTVSSLNVIFNSFGPIESTRVLTHKNCGFVNFETLESAVRAKSQLNGKEIFPGAGPVRIGFAKVPSASGTPGANGLFPSPSPDPNAKLQNDIAAPHRANSLKVNSGRGDSVPVAPSTPALQDITGDIVEIVKELGATDDEQMHIASAVQHAAADDRYRDEIPPIDEPSHNRVHDAPRLRDIRKRIDNHSCTQAEIEDIAMGMLPEIAELASDYLGNTVVQKLFEYCSEPVKEAMLAEIAPQLAQIGVHKNGTWAAQKIIDVARSPALMNMIVDALRPYAGPLFLDQFGNYVIQGCLRYQYPLNDFIFQTMLHSLWELAQGRFGARAMRACLESHYATKDQQRIIAAAIALHSVQLATNANGALLLTWFLDTCTFPRRRTVLAPRLVPHLVHLCTHKVAYLTVLKIINQRNEPEARDTVLQALFFSQDDRVLQDILSDQTCGATFIFKVLTTPFFDEKLRPDVVNNVKKVLLQIKAQSAQGYKRLMDEVGLSTRNGGPVRDSHGPRDSSETRPGSKHSMMNGQFGSPSIEAAARGQYFPNPQMNQGPYDPAVGLQRTASMDSNSFDGYSMNGVNPAMFTPQANVALPAMTQQQLQYQQAMLANAANSRQNAYYPQMGGQMGGISNGPPMDAFRGVAGSPISAPGMNGSPMLQQGGFPQQGYNQMMSPQMYQYPVQFMPQQQMATGGRRGRVSSLSSVGS